MEELLGEPADFRRHGGGEEQGLAGDGSSLQMRSMSGMKPMSSIRSASSITRILTLGEHELAALEMIEQPAGRGDQHVDAAVELFVLVVRSETPPISKRMAELGSCRSGRSFLPPGRPARGWAPGPGRAACAPWRGRGRASSIIGRVKAGGLAGAGLGDAEHIAPLQDNGNALSLNRGGGGVAGIDDSLEDFGREPQAVKAARGRRRRRSGCNFAGSGFRAGGRYLGRSTLLIGARPPRPSLTARIGRPL